MNVRIFLSFIAGGLIGGAIGWNMCSRAYTDRLEELEIQNEDLIEENRKYAHRGSEDISEASERVKSENDPRDKLPKGKNGEYVDYVRLSQQYKSDSFDEHFASRAHPTDEDDEEDDLIEEDDAPKQIRVISAEQFRKDLNYRDNETITFYQEDDVLCDSTNEIIHDQESVIGEKCMGMINDTDQDFIYIDNEFEDKIYEIIVEHEESFYRDVMAP